MTNRMSITKELFPDTIAIDIYGNKTLSTSAMSEVTPLDTSLTGIPSGKVKISSSSIQDSALITEGSSYSNKFTITSAATVVSGPKNIYFKTATDDGTYASITDEMTITQIVNALSVTTLEGFTITKVDDSNVLVTSNIHDSLDAVDLDLGTDVTITFTEDVTAGVDDIVGTGAHTIQIKGITKLGLLSKEIITLDGQTQVESTVEYSSIISQKVLTAGPGNVNAGKIYIGSGVATSGVPTTGYSIIPIGLNYSAGCVYTVPNSYDSWIEKIDFVNPTASEIITIRIMSDYSVVKELKVGAGVSSIEFIYPIKVEGRVSISAKSTSTTPSVTANISGLMIKKY